ncbi:MAG: glycosyltransferase [Gluconacetobacter diazotrophicus]|nr:glycosyltransferase [Gluconacetobacter diazotrophicus]
MSVLPRISVVVPSLNQGKFLAETLQSLADQHDASLEVIVQDGGSTDGSAEIAREFARRFPDVFQVHVEPDRGQAHALNLGFAKTRGEILGYLNADDTLFPGCLRQVTREIDPSRGRWVVFGRSVFTGEGPHLGVEHPAEFVSRFEQLAIWKRGFNTLPQPSVFWHRRVWETCGGLDEREHHVLDYDLFCRFSARFHFHKVDALWSTYRWHEESKSAQRSESEVLALCVAASRRHWPRPWHPLRWRLAFSRWLHDRQAHERARHHARRAEQAFAEGRRLSAAGEFCRTLALSPAMAWHRLLQPVLAGRGLRLVERWLFQREVEYGPVGEFTGRYADGWIGPLYEETISLPAGAQRLVLPVRHVPFPDGQHARIETELFVGRRSQGKQVCTAAGVYELRGDVRRHAGRTCRVVLRTSPYFVPGLVEAGSTDMRKLCAKLEEVRVETETADAHVLLPAAS